MLINEIITLLKKDTAIEMRNQRAFGGIIIYMLSALFIYYLSIRTLDDMGVWNALIWITLLFSGVNAAAKSFLQDNEKVFFYLHSLVSPQALILSKIIFNLMVFLVLSVLCIAVIFFWAGNQISDFFLFPVIIFLGSTGISSLLTFVASISSKASGQPVLVAILSFPIILPLLLTLIRATENIFTGKPGGSSYDEILILASLDIIIIALAYILFPYLWKE